MRARRGAAAAGVAAWCALLAPAAARAQQWEFGYSHRPYPDSVRLGDLQAAAAAADPRLRELDLLAAQSDLRLRDIAAERLPSFTSEALAQYQSDVTRIPLRLPGGATVPGPAHDTYDARVNAQEVLVDPSAGPRRAAERATRAEAQARVRVALLEVRQQVNDAFFAAAAAQVRMQQLRSSTTELEARLGEARARVTEGAALPSDTLVVMVAIAQYEQERIQLLVDRHAALRRLGVLTGRRIVDEEAVAIPDLRDAAAYARGEYTRIRARPEYEQFEHTRERLGRLADVAGARERPKLAAFGRLGYGRPGLNVLSRDFDTYWTAGLQVQWAPWNWGAVRREREVLRLQRETTEAEEAAFARAVRSAAESDIDAIDRAGALLANDMYIQLLREGIEHETRARFQEGVVTAAEYVARQEELTRARLMYGARRVELEQARARLLTTLGVEVR